MILLLDCLIFLRSNVVSIFVCVGFYISGILSQLATSKRLGSCNHILVCLVLNSDGSFRSFTFIFNSLFVLDIGELSACKTSC